MRIVKLFEEIPDDFGSIEIVKRIVNRQIGGEIGPGPDMSPFFDGI